MKTQQIRGGTLGFLTTWLWCFGWMGCWDGNTIQSLEMLSAELLELPLSSHFVVIAQGVV